MKIAHVRERHAPAGAPWRLAAALPATTADGPPRDAGPLPAEPAVWLDLEVARRRATAADRNLAHDRAMFRQPLTTLDDHLGRGLRVEALADLVDGCTRRGRAGDDDALLDAADVASGP